MTHPRARRGSYALLPFALCTALGCAHETTVARPVRPAAIAPLEQAGDAPVDEAVHGVPQVRARWFRRPEGGPRLYVLQAGPERSAQLPLLLIHGIGDGGSQDFHPVLASLASKRPIIAVDLPGFGHSDRRDEDLTPEGSVRALASVLEAMGEPRVDVLGHSSGAALGMLLAAQEPERVRRLVMLGVVGVLRPETLLRSQLHENLNDTREKAPVRAKVFEKAGDAFVNAMSAVVPSASKLGKSGLLGKSANVRLATTLIDYNFGPAMLTVRAPTLLLWGTEDEVAPVRVGHFLDDRIPNSKLEFLAEASHVPMRDEAAEDFVNTVDAYLRGPVAGEPAEFQATRGEQDAHCKDQEDFELEGDYRRVVLEGCKHAWLNRVRAREVVVRDSEVRFDHVYVQEGVRSDDSKLVITGGELRGEVPLDLKGGQHDVAGTLLRGSLASVRVREAAVVLFSVTRLESPRSIRFVHEEVQLGKGDLL